MDAEVAKYIEALKEEDWEVRYHAATALGSIGDSSAIPALLETLKDEEGNVHPFAANKTVALPRKVLASTGLSPKQKLEALNALRRVIYSRYARSILFDGLKPFATLVTKDFSPSRERFCVT
jgi:HEAT repeat protein